MQLAIAQRTSLFSQQGGVDRRCQRRSPSVQVSCHLVPEHSSSISRRHGLAAGIAIPLGSTVASGLALPQSAVAKGADAAPFKLPDLPYGLDDLAPRMSKTTLEFHWGKHHAAYLNNLNNQVKGTELEKLPLQEVMLRSWNNGQALPTFNNAAQSVNHAFFWESMAPGGGGQPGGKLASAISRDFGSFDAFAKEFKAAGATQFGSGWAWLVVGKDGKLKVAKTPNAENPWVKGETPILTMDVWEHAYYLDVQNRRPDYIANFMDGLVNWDRVAERFKVATA